MSDMKENVTKLSDDKEIINVLYEISRLLKTNLDKESLVCCVKLCENGANPEGLAHAVKEIRQSVKNTNRSIQS